MEKHQNNILLRKGGERHERKVLKVEDIMETLGISKSAAYKLMRELNDEMVRRLRYRDGKTGGCI